MPFVAYAAEDQQKAESAGGCRRTRRNRRDLMTPQSVTPSGAARPIDPIQDRINVASHQIDTREYAEARSQLDAIIADLEQQRSRYDPSLMVPLTLLGDALSGEAEVRTGVGGIRAGGHITRITDGLHSTEQVGIVYREADTYASMGKVDKANDRQEYAYETLVRQYGPIQPGTGSRAVSAWRRGTTARSICSPRAICTSAPCRSCRTDERRERSEPRSPRCAASRRHIETNASRHTRWRNRRRGSASRATPWLRQCPEATASRQSFRNRRDGVGAVVKITRSEPERETARYRAGGTRSRRLVPACSTSRRARFRSTFTRGK